jgi:hypothetical protein
MLTIFDEKLAKTILYNQSLRCGSHRIMVCKMVGRQGSGCGVRRRLIGGTWCDPTHGGPGSFLFAADSRHAAYLSNNFTNRYKLIVPALYILKCKSTLPHRPRNCSFHLLSSAEAPPPSQLPQSINTRGALGALLETQRNTSHLGLILTHLRSYPGTTEFSFLRGLAQIL